MIQTISLFKQKLQSFQNDLNSLFPKIFTPNNYSAQPISPFVNEVISIYETNSSSTNNDQVSNMIKREESLIESEITTLKNLIKYFSMMIEKTENSNKEFVKSFSSSNNDPSNRESIGINKLKENNSKLRMDLENFRMEFAKMKKKYMEIQKIVSEKDTKILKLRKMYNSKVEMNEDLHEIIKKKEKKISFLEDENSSLQYQIESDVVVVPKKGSGADKTSNSSSNSGDKNDESGDYKSLVSKFSSLKNECDELKIVCKQRSSVIDTRDDQIAELQKEKLLFNSKQSEIIKKSPLYESRDALLHEFKEKNQNLITQINLRESEVDRYKLMNVKRNDNINDEISNKIDVISKKVIQKNNELNELQKKFKEVKLKLSSTNYQDNIAEQLKQSNIKLESKEKRLAKLQSEISLYGEDKSVIIQKLQFSQKNSKILKKKLNEEKSEKERWKLMSKNDVEKKKFEKILKDNSDYKSEIEKLKEDIKCMSSSGGDGEGVDLDKMNEIKEDLMFEREVTEQYEKELQELRNHCDKLTNYKDKLQKEQRLHEREKGKLLLQSVKDKKRIQSYKNEIEVLQKEIKVLKETNVIRGNKNEKMVKLLNVKEEMIEEYKNNANIARNANEKFQKDIIDINMSLSKLKKEKEQSVYEVKAQTQLAESFIEKNKDLEKKSIHYQEECERLVKRIEVIEKSQGNEHLLAKIQNLRALSMCTICKARKKNKVITRCAHAFCDVCLETSTKSRNRKCPGCGNPFNPHTEISNLYL